MTWAAFMEIQRTHDELSEPSPSARQAAFRILQRHPPCLRDGVPLNDLIDDIAAAIDNASSLKRGQRHMTHAEEVWNAAIEEAAKVAESHFRGIFTGWKGYTSESLITLDDAESAAEECGPICAEAIRDLKRT